MKYSTLASVTSSIALIFFLTIGFTFESRASDIIDCNLGKCISKTRFSATNPKCILKEKPIRSDMMIRSNMIILKNKFPTGLERDIPIILLTRKEFNDRLEQSPLWNVINKRINDFKYRSFYYLDKSLESTGPFSTIALESSISANPYDSQELTKINYSLYNSKETTHSLSDRQLSEMIEVLKIVIKDLDHQQASQIIKDLYTQYTKKLDNKEFILNGTVLAHVEYNEKIIAFHGVENCVMNRFLYMEIT